MDSERYVVRPFGERDHEPASRIRAAISPEFTYTANEERQWEARLDRTKYIQERWTVAERSTGHVAAIAELGQSPWMYHPAKFWAAIAVDPAHRGRGIGRTLATLIESEAAAHRAITLWATVRTDDARSVEFSRRHGFTEQRRVWVSALDLGDPSGFRPPPDRGAELEGQGLRFSMLAEEGSSLESTRKKLYDLVNEGGKDVPRIGDYTPVTYEEFVNEVTSPVHLHDGTFLAIDGDRYVAMSDLERSEAHADTLRVGFTCSLREYRGRGIASELKRRALVYASAKGAHYLQTVNDSLNAPMWAINQKMGFRILLEWANLERALAPTSPPSAADGSL